MITIAADPKHLGARIGVLSVNAFDRCAAPAARSTTGPAAFRQSRPTAARRDADSSTVDGEVAMSDADGLSRFTYT